MAVRCNAAGGTVVRTTNLPSIANFTIMAWALLSVNTGAAAYALAFGQFGAYRLGVSDDGSTVSAYESYTEVQGGTWTLGTWKHLAITVAGTGAGQALFYVDGALLATLDGHTEFVGATLRLGAVPESPTLQPWNGRVAAHKAYDVVLTAAQIQQEMRQYLPVNLASLNAWAPLLLHTDLKDYSGLARDYTGTGTLTTEDGPPIPWARQPQPRRRTQRRRLLPFMMQHSA
jgi:concanavalin A-like lectin/glucanase superfamily protein